ncbi:SDR family NAD(P)-dependent oxidoreductase [Mycobacterium terramassiliense]|nr:SDR family NAD(P)-dependent oxidoreductase [Mycobacterium terramassiliense]
MQKTWFVTGSSRGFGRAVVRAALGNGNSVAATARRPERLDDLVAEFGDRIYPIGLDVADPDAVQDSVSEAWQRFGRLDVVVNNAGYANVAPIETGDAADFRAQFETNFWGVYHVSKAVIPLLRKQGGGVIIQFSSIGGRVGGTPGIASYQAAKFAIDGFSRVLRAETAPFGIKVLVVEPSGFSTDWAGSSMTVHAIPDIYSDTVGVMNTVMRQPDAGAAGDPERAAQILVQIADRKSLPEHLPLGVNAAESAIQADLQLLHDDLTWRRVSRSADYAEPYPVQFPADCASKVGTS